MTTVLSECFDWALVSGGVSVGGIGVGYGGVIGDG